MRKPYMTAILMCWICLAVYGLPGLAPNRSMKVLVAPYTRIVALSTNSAEGGRRVMRFSFTCPLLGEIISRSPDGDMLRGDSTVSVRFTGLHSECDRLLEMRMDRGEPAGCVEVVEVADVGATQGFHAHPRSAQAPRYLANVKRPYKKNIEPSTNKTARIFESTRPHPMMYELRRRETATY